MSYGQYNSVTEINYDSDNNDSKMIIFIIKVILYVEKKELILICHQGKKSIMVKNQEVGEFFWKKWKKILLTKDLLLDHYLLQQTFH